MENNNISRYSRPSQPHAATSVRQIRSGYEPSDVDTDWRESPQSDHNRGNGVPDPESPKMHLDLPRILNAMSHRRRQSSKFEDSSPRKDTLAIAVPRRHSSKSPYKPRREDGGTISPISVRRNISPLPKSEHRRQVSPYKSRRDVADDAFNNNEIVGSNRRKNQQTPNGEERSNQMEFSEVTRVSERSPYGRRSITPRQRTREKEQENKGRTLSPLPRKEKEPSHVKAPSVGELNEMVANIKMSRGPVFNPNNFESTDSFSPGDIFFSRDQTAFAMQTNEVVQNGDSGSNFYPRPTRFPHNDSLVLQQNKANGRIDHKIHNQRKNSSSGSRITMNSTSAMSRMSSKVSTESSKISDVSGRTTDSMKKFTADRRKSQADTWLSCLRRGPCKTSKSPEKQHIDEASFIERAFVVESLRQLWADKHQPCSLNGFACHKQEAQLLKQLVSHDNIPHMLLKGPSDCGKRALAMAFLGEIFGDTCRNISHDLRYFQAQDQRMQLAVPVTSSAYHVELNVNSEPNAKYALMNLVKEMSNNYAITPEVSSINYKPDYKVIILYEVGLAAENIQHLIKWIMDCYTDACKLILCCEDDVDILESVKNRCKVIKVDAPVTHEIMEVMIQIARKEDFDLPMNFAAKIAAKSKQNLRKAITALEACKAHNYPFVDDQPIPFGWEEVLIELAGEVLSDPSPKKLFFIRGKFQKLLVDFVHPRLILLKLAELFLKGVDANLKRELYYWHAYYDKRLPTGTAALLKLEEFVAKFMGIYRRSCGDRQYE